MGGQAEPTVIVGLVIHLCRLIDLVVTVHCELPAASATKVDHGWQVLARQRMFVDRLSCERPSLCALITDHRGGEIQLARKADRGRVAASGGDRDRDP